MKYGYIAHGNQGFWLEGPLPSPRCARLLVQFYDGIDVDQIPEATRQALNMKWQLLQEWGKHLDRYPQRRKEVEWLVDLEALVPYSDEVKQTLDFYGNIPIYKAAGPYLAEDPVDKWTGENC